jgi:glycosyltransferase involved in cell wall biosynthesis
LSVNCKRRDTDRPLVLHVIHSLEGGGTERVLVDLLRACDAALFRHAVVTQRAAGSLASALPDHVPCVPMGACGRSWATGLHLGLIARTLRPTILHARNTGCWNDALVAGMLTPGTRLVLGFHGLESASCFSRGQRRSAKWGMHWGARFTSVSEAGRCQLHAEAHIPAERIEVLENGVRLERFSDIGVESRRMVREALLLPDSAFVVGTVGSFTAVKNQTLLISAVAQLTEAKVDVRLLIVGDGPLHESLAQQALEVGIADRVCFTGWREDVPALLSAMDAYVCSSVSEGMSNAVLEAMAAGLPIVSTDVGDNTVMIRNHREGLIVEPQSATALTQALRTLVFAPDLRRRLGAAALARARSYNFEQVVRRYECYYRRLIASPARRWYSFGGLAAARVRLAKVPNGHVGPVAQRLEQGCRGGVVRFDKSGDDPDAVVADGRVTGCH